MTLYFNAAVDTDWDTLGNWWEDEPCTVAASALPTSSDDVVLLAICDANSGGDPTVANLEVSADSRSIWITITVTGLAMFSGVGSSNYGTITGDCVFSGEGSNNQGAVTGNCTFSGDYSFNRNATVTGTVTFRNLSSIIETFLVPSGYYEPSFANEPAGFKFPFADVLGTNLL
jgi:hypothetical protein